MSGLGVLLAPMHTADKNNEITVIPELPEALLLKSAIMSRCRYF